MDMVSRIDPAMHANGFRHSHCLPPAGIKSPKDIDVFRFNRPVPLYESDPCIAPDSGYMVCPPDCGNEKRNEHMRPAGVCSQIDNTFQFYKVHQAAPQPKPACACPAFANNPPCSALGPVTDLHKCPCINRPSNISMEPQAHPPLSTSPQQQQQPLQLRQQPQATITTMLPPQCQLQAGVGRGGMSRVGRQQCQNTAQDSIESCYHVNNRPMNATSLGKIPLCNIGGGKESGVRQGAIAPTPNSMLMTVQGGRMDADGGDGGSCCGGGGGGSESGRGGGLEVTGNSLKNSTTTLDNCVGYHCQNPYYPSTYTCRPVYDRKYLEDCPEQNGVHPDFYTFL